ncbi:Low density lipoprotein receptor adapter protein 1 [Zootermopsis nevadensis]|uniref:Low density lipoprotein receptor adapter protein 1 n=2 Tax=Zootermopsis nevadensis TaxID=136037 RepID=A0A067RDV8_ZOONE|nr:Low density lipoprotein receptor adapter protein 1 [Zootermopsis nevadensis]
MVKYLGSVLVEAPSNDEATAEAIDTIMTMVNVSGKKLQRVELSVDLHGIKVVDLGTEDTHLEVSIYRISNCSADAAHDRVFAFIAKNTNETMECHAFLCHKRKIAQTITLTVAQSFNTAYELWQISQETSCLRNQELRSCHEVKKISSSHNKIKDSSSNLQHMSESKTLLIDLSPESETLTENGNSWVCFDDDRSENLNSNFTRITSSLTQKQNPVINSPQHHLHILASSNGQSSNVTSGWEDNHSSNFPWS